MNLDIYQLSKLVSKQKVKALGLFRDNKINSETKYLFLFENIVDNKIKNDTEAQRALNYSPNSKSFVKLKERYTKKILDYIMLSDAHIASNEYVNEEHFRLLKLYAVARIIQYKQQRSNAVKIYKYIFSHAKKLELEDLQLFSGLVLRQNFAFISPDKKLYKYYNDELTRVNKSIIKSMKISEYYDKISHENLSTNEENIDSYRKNTLQESLEFLDSITEIDSFLYKSQAYEIAAFAYSINNELEKSIDISKKSITLIKKSEYTPDYKIYAAYKDIMSTYLKLKDFDNAKTYLNKSLGMLTKKHFNYFKLKSIEYTIYANIKDYTSLFILTMEVISSKSLIEFNTNLQEWKLREAFSNILLETGRINKDLLINVNCKEFKLRKFMNEVNLFTKDKRGTNISILVVELMHFLISKQYDKVSDKLDALNQYTFRYLRNDNTLRSNCFIKMLLKIPEAEYHPLRTIRYVKKYEQKLRENPFEISLKDIDVEIIPYEHLWEIILDILDLNLNKRKN